MRYVDWYSFQMSKGDVTKEKPPKNSLAWRDVVTDTVFYLDTSNLDRIVIKTMKHLKTICQKPDEVYNFLSGKDQGIDDEIKLFPLLPYKKGTEEKAAHRICDHFIVRTGLAYALLHKQIPKEEIRLWGLLYGINFHGGDQLVEPKKELTQTLKQLDLALTGQGNSITEQQFDIVKGGAVKVKQYFLETNNIKDIRGASKLLDKINLQILPSYISENYIPESIVYSGGGNLLAIVPKGEGDDLSTTIEKAYEKITVTGQSVAAYKTVTIDELINYKDFVLKLEESLKERQMLKFDWRTNPQEGDLNYLSEESSNLSIYVDYPDYKGQGKNEDICDHCNIRFATKKLHDEKLCLSCLHKVIEGGRDGKSDFVTKFLDYSMKNQLNVSKVDVQSLEDITSGYNTNFIGVIYGDGNNMGQIVQNIESLAQMRYFSEITERAIFEAVYKALGESLAETSFEIIAIGGDDILMVVPGEKAVEIGRELGLEFDRRFKNLSDKKNTVTMSLGIAISQYSTPIQYIFDLSQQLLKNAKKKAKLTGKGTMDLVVTESNAAIGASLASNRKEMQKNNFIYTLRPYTWDETSVIEGAIKKLKQQNLRSKCYSFRETVFNQSIEEANLFYLYQLSRFKNREKDAKKAIQETVKDLSDVFGGRETVMNISINDKKYSPWLDIVELWDYVPEKGGSVNG